MIARTPARGWLAARGAYARSIRVQLQAIGIDDLPRNGAFILAGIDAADGPRPDLTAALGVTKQAVSQVTDTLVSRGHLERGPDPTTGGGLLRERVPAEQVDAMRAAPGPGRDQDRQ
jgi:hypothetical protein